MSSIEILVMFGSNNRKLTLPEDITLESLIKEFLNAFVDVIPPSAAQTEFLYQKYDSRYQEWVDMDEDEKICDGEKIRVLSLSSTGTIFPGVLPHKVMGNTTYRIWSLVSRANSSLMKRDDTTMKCIGNASNKANLLDVKAKDVSSSTTKMFQLELAVSNTPSEVYLITGKGENQDVKVQKVNASSLPDTTETKFEPEYFYSFTQFRCTGVNGETDLYLASDVTGKVTLAKGGLSGYPNPATLFICSQFI